jgi:hypothetical protein
LRSSTNGLFERRFDLRAYRRNIGRRGRDRRGKCLEHLVGGRHIARLSPRYEENSRPVTKVRNAEMSVPSLRRGLMNRSKDSFVIVGVVMLLAVACSGGGDMKSDGGSGSGSGSGGSALGKNASVPDTCQMCLSMSSSNECQAKGKICTTDSECSKLNERGLYRELR